MIKILEDAKITRHTQQIGYHIPIEYNGNKYVIVCYEDDNDRYDDLHTYDENARFNIGEEYSGDDYDEVYEKIIDTMQDAGMLYSGTEKGTIIETED